MMRYISALSFIIAFSITPAWAKITASLSANEVALGDSVTLIFQSDEQIKSLPDLSPIQQQVKILSTGKSSNVSMVNGVVSKTHSVSLKIYPFQEGEIIIPSFDFDGNKTEPLKLTVLKQNTSQNQILQNPVPAYNVSFDSAIIPQTIYEGQTAIYQTDIYENAGLKEASITPPRMANLAFQQLNADKAYTKTIDSVQMNYFQRNFALTPNKTGVFQIPASELSGFVPDKTKPRNPFDITQDFFDFSSRLTPFMQPQKEVFFRSNPIELSVKEKPTDWQGWWFPSDKVTLSQEFKMPNKIYEGDTIERQITLTAQFIDSAKMPLITHPTTDDLTVFENQEERFSVFENDKLVSTEIRSFILVPQKAGKFTIPPVLIEYFNTLTGTKEFVRVEGKEFEILPKKTTASVNKELPLEVISEKVEPILDNKEKPSTARSNKILYISIGFIGLILFSFYLFLRHKGKKKNLTLSEIETPLDSKSKKKKKKPLPDLYPF